MVTLFALALAAQPVVLPVETSHRAADAYEEILYRVMREVKKGMPDECYKVRVGMDLGGEELEQIDFTCLDEEDRRLDVDIPPGAMPVEAIAARYKRLREVLDEKATRGQPYEVAMTVDRRGRLHTQLVFFDVTASR